MSKIPKAFERISKKSSLIKTPYFGWPVLGEFFVRFSTLTWPVVSEKSSGSRC